MTMVVVSQSSADLDDHRFPFINTTTCKPLTTAVTQIPVIDLSEPPETCGSKLVRACKEFGFFKVVNHGVSDHLTNRLETEAIRFFGLSQAEKNRHGPADPFGYGSKRIGSNGDVGWLEYLLLHANPDIQSPNVLSAFHASPHIFRSLVEEYVGMVKGVACELLELLSQGLGLDQKDALSRFLVNEKSDSFFRLNHYPPSPPAAVKGQNKQQLLGFGEHTDPQIISILRSNDTSGLQISLNDTWIPVPPDHSSFFVIVGDSLQVMSNGRFKSVKHRVVAEDPGRSRVSMIYFGGPPLNEKIEPIKGIMEEGEESFYNEFTWTQYKLTAYKSRLADYRLGLFEKKKKKLNNNHSLVTSNNI